VWRCCDCALFRVVRRAETCPTGSAWFARPDSSTTPHEEVVECSNAGSCDYRSGVCRCLDGFEGPACSVNKRTLLLFVTR
jgi:hypothetical protein